MKKQLFLVYNSEEPLYVAAENIKRVTDVYDPQKIEKIATNLMVLRDDAECSARGNQSTFEAKDELIKKLKWTLSNAVSCEEKHYENDETTPGWIIEAKELL